MILLLGGTAETQWLAGEFAGQGWRTLVSTATAIPLELPESPLVERRSGPLDEAGLQRLLTERAIELVVDATHPYAVRVKEICRAACAAAGVKCLRYERPVTETAGTDLRRVPDHETAARLAFSFGRPVLLTIGSRNVEPYVREARRTGLRCVARVLADAASLRSCRAVGLAENDIIAASGPFSREENLTAIRACAAGVLVTKDGGAPGGVPAKLEAARQTGTVVVLVERPPVANPGFSSLEALLSAMKSCRLKPET